MSEGGGVGDVFFVYLYVSLQGEDKFSKFK